MGGRKEVLPSMACEGVSSSWRRCGEEDDHPHLHDFSSDDDAAHHDAVAAEPSTASHPSLGDRSIFDRPQPSSACGLPSASDAFSEENTPIQVPLSHYLQFCSVLLKFGCLCKLDGRLHGRSNF
ncbi:hypothetical protein Ahy_B03g062039 isoform B [Arachis hypogaea]|uniref:Uncharacterized protein n=1 Tax=Arachis hypogaea TaxID=3818 RepID=A0A444ZSU8_ARAHY|nr:hypothetical protein Ahy_B03g062039 isoform B [Arachis hypogaea]